jgi:very-short-patch-repair endonuclease
MRGADGKKTERARQLRKSTRMRKYCFGRTCASGHLNSFEFVRQLTTGPCFADFACREKMLVVEVDGSQHAGSEYDRK